MLTPEAEEHLIKLIQDGEGGLSSFRKAKQVAEQYPGATAEELRQIIAERFAIDDATIADSRQIVSMLNRADETQRLTVLRKAFAGTSSAVRRATLKDIRCLFDSPM